MVINTSRAGDTGNQTPVFLREMLLLTLCKEALSLVTDVNAMFNMSNAAGLIAYGNCRMPYKDIKNSSEIDLQSNQMAIGDGDYNNNESDPAHADMDGNAINEQVDDDFYPESYSNSSSTDVEDLYTVHRPKKSLHV